MWKSLILTTMAGSVAATTGGWLDSRRDAMPSADMLILAQAEATEPTTVAREEYDRHARAIHLSRDKDGLFYVNAYIGSVPVRFLVDTGATTTVLAARDARRICALRSRESGSVRMATAGGSSSVRRVLLDRLSVAPQRYLDQVDAVVTNAALPASLLGQDSLSRLGSITIRGDVMTLG